MVVVQRGREKCGGVEGKRELVVVQRGSEKWHPEGRRRKRALDNKEKTELFPNKTWYSDPELNKLKQVGVSEAPPTILV